MEPSDVFRIVNLFVAAVMVIGGIGQFFSGSLYVSVPIPSRPLILAALFPLLLVYANSPLAN